MKLLLHTCCAPCLSGAYKPLAGEGHDIAGYFFNPNIQPEEEMGLRIEALKKYSDKTQLKAVIVGSYDPEIFKRQVLSASGDRCFNCYVLRLSATALYAAANGYETFSTTLLLSPYQKHDMIRTAGEEVSQRSGIEFLYRDLRPYYRDSVEISKSMDLYRQKYCGCILSIPVSRRK